MRGFANWFALLILFDCGNACNNDEKYCERSDQYYSSFDNFLPSGYNPDSVVYGPLTATSPRTLLTAEFDFALSLLNKLSADESCIVSPFSISLALSLVHSGTKGTTRKQIEDALLNGAANEKFSQHFSNLIENISKVTNGVDFQLANRAFVRQTYPLLNSYLSSISDYYKADAVSLDFDDRVGSAEAVNSFVSEVTRGKIEGIVNEEMFEPSLVMILVNAVYMNATWADEFDNSDTQPRIFSVNQTIEEKVDFMSQSKVHRYYYENEQYQLLSLEYKDSRYRFNVFLPKEKFKLEKLQRKLTGEEIEEILSTKLNKEYLNIRIPKFKLESEIGLVPILKKLGVEGIFSPSKELSGFSEDSGLYVSDAIHKAIIEVDEKGTVAAAVTLIGMVGEGGGFPGDEQPISFIADHPFMFCITFDNHPIFIGKYYE